MRILILIYFLLSCNFVNAEEINKKDAIKAIMGEARGEGYRGLLAVACGIRNRGTLKGVYGLKAKFKEPQWVWDLAKKAWEESKKKDIVNGATMWENILTFGKPRWYNDVVEVYRYKNHVFFKEKEKK